MASKTDIYDNKWLDLVFEDRNKAYGAFELRQRSAHYTVLAILFAIVAFGLTISSPIIVNYIKGFVPPEPIPREIQDTTVVVEAPPLDDVKDPIPDLPPPPPLRETLQYTPPVIKEDDEIEEPVVLLNQEDTVQTADKTQKGTQDSIPFDILPTDDVYGDGGEPALDFVQVMPQFPEGDAALTKFIHDKLEYPRLAKENNIQGRVVVRFVVEKDGTLSNFEIISQKKLGWGCEEEVLRVVKLLPRFIPGKQNGNAVRVKFILPVTFKLV